MEEYFDLIGNNITLDKNKTLITNNYNSWIGDSWNSVYGVTIISGTTNQTYHAKFKIITKNTSTSAINIGIECDQWNHLNMNFTDEYSNPDGEYYAYCSNGKKYSNKDECEYGKSFSDSYGNNDIIHMKLQFIVGVDYGLLYFKKNDLKWQDTHFKIKKTKKIKIAVSLRSASYFDGGQSSLELISFSCSDEDQNENDISDEKTENKTPIITINKDEFDSSQQSDITQLQMQISSMKQQLNNKQDKYVSLEKANHLLRDERDKIQNKLQGKQDENMEKQKVIDDLTQQLVHYKKNFGDEKKGNNDFKDDLKYLEQKLNEFNVNYDRNKVLQMYNNSPADLLMVNEEINALDLRLRSFSKYLMDIKSYIDTLSYPDIGKYKEWSLNEMIQWILLLDNGRYKKYVNVFRKGFKSDGINGSNLPDLDKNVLRNAPFNISNFGDRKNLEEHFQSLSNKFIIKNAENEEIYNAENNEGSLTEYHI